LRIEEKMTRKGWTVTPIPTTYKQ